MRFVSSLVIAALFATGAMAAGAVHRDRGTLPLGCASCHDSHGVENTGSLPAAEEAFCYLCHGDPATQLQTRREGRLSGSVRLPDMSAEFRKVSRHPVDRKGDHARIEEQIPRGARHAECVDCHNHHDSTIAPRHQGDARGADLQPFQYEYQVCLRCHTAESGASRDVGMEFDRTSRSKHPVLEPNTESVPGLLRPWRSGDQMNCTDCHGNSDPKGPQGPHGSDFAPLLKYRYETGAGGESARRYELCYRCHSRDALFTRSRFPEHRRHVRTDGESCATCHNAHGSEENRALIDFETARRRGLVNSTRTGRLDFVSTSPGRGACWVSCHNRSHEGTAYGR